MMPTSHPRRLSALLLLGLFTSAAAAVPDGPQTLRFKAYLDKRPIGEHSFSLAPEGDQLRVVSRANFTVDFLVFTAYRYRHESRELWRDGCLDQIQSTTDDNGTDYQVEGTREASALVVASNGNSMRLPQCVSTFAYWNPDFLKQQRLMNPQTGELTSVQVDPTGSERRAVGGKELEVQGYRLRADSVDIRIWYDTAGNWVGLESDTGKGRMLRYERL